MSAYTTTEKINYQSLVENLQKKLNYGQ